MSQHELPDDIRSWPHDPYKLLGITPGAAPRVVRLAYTRLIRVYRPEAYPEQFRRIRAAYETLSGSGPQLGDSMDTLYHQRWPVDVGTGDGERAESHDRAVRRPSMIVDDLDEIWHEACDGDMFVAYRRLSQAQARSPWHARPYAMLYWHLAVDPGLDSSRHRCDWLAEGILQCGFRQPLDLLYTRELAAHPDEAVSARFTALLESDLVPMDGEGLYSWRWAALAGRPDNLERLLGDLVRLQARSATLHDWKRFVVDAIRHLAWLQHTLGGQAAFHRYWRELQDVDAVDWQIAADIDSLEWNIEIATEIQSLAPPPPLAHLAQFIESSCRLPRQWVQVALMRWLRTAIARPSETLEFYDGLESQSPLLLARIVEIVEDAGEYEYPMSDEARVALEPAVFSFFNRTSYARYEKLRDSVLDFCLRELISPHSMSMVMLGQEKAIRGRLASLARQIAEDVPLRAVYQSHQLFWA